MAATAPAIPAELAAFRLVQAGDLDAATRAALLEINRKVPRPPKLLTQLLSPEFVSNASSSQLSDLIVAEPVIAGKLLAAINSPYYGLRSPVSSVEQAVRLLGLTSVRVLCLRYVMRDCFCADSPARQEVVGQTWQASALACELTQRLANNLGLPEPGTLVSQVVLTFLGRLATASAMPQPWLARIPSRGLLARATAEQEVLGLTAIEIGRLLMRAWRLPAALIDDACDIDAVLVNPVEAFDPVRGSRLALCYLAARLGERLACDPAVDLSAFDVAADTDPEFHHLKGYLRHPALKGLPGALSEPSLMEQIARLRQSLNPGLSATVPDGA